MPAVYHSIQHLIDLINCTLKYCVNVSETSLLDFNSFSHLIRTSWGTSGRMKVHRDHNKSTCKKKKKNSTWPLSSLLHWFIFHSLISSLIQELPKTTKNVRDSYCFQKLKLEIAMQCLFQLTFFMFWDINQLADEGAFFSYSGHITSLHEQNSSIWH